MKSDTNKNNVFDVWTATLIVCLIYSEFFFWMATCWENNTQKGYVLLENICAKII